MNFHINLARQGGIPTEFRLLNQGLPMRVGFNASESHDNAEVLRALFDQSPGGGTPLCRHIHEVIQSIQAVEGPLRASGQRACVIIATDGESSDGDVAQALRPLKDLPAWVVVRLCTNEDKIVNYWNDIDSVLELDMDVLDDLFGEAGEVQAVNPWLNYNEVMHRIREFGVSFKELDMLDERLLSLEQFKRVCKLM